MINSVAIITVNLVKRYKTRQSYTASHSLSHLSVEFRLRVSSSILVFEFSHRVCSEFCLHIAHLIGLIFYSTSLLVLLSHLCTCVYLYVLASRYRGRPIAYEYLRKLTTTTNRQCDCSDCIPTRYSVVCLHQSTTDVSYRATKPSTTSTNLHRIVHHLRFFHIKRTNSIYSTSCVYVKLPTRRFSPNHALVESRFRVSSITRVRAFLL